MDSDSTVEWTAGWSGGDGMDLDAQPPINSAQKMLSSEGVLDKLTRTLIIEGNKYRKCI